MHKIKRVIAIIFIALLAVLPTRADSTRVSLLTCSPGEELYELFGHTALRYTDKSKGIDIVFGYGYFSFDTPNFVWRFMLGETDYMVGAVSYRQFIEEYSHRGSGVTEQTISLDSLQKQKLFDTLVTNCQAENRKYRYNYFYNNCTTKIRDKIAEILNSGEKLFYSTPLQANSIRSAVAQHTATQPWSEFGINLLLGADVDAPATRDTLQFLPAYLMNDFATAQISDGEIARPLVGKQKTLLQPQERKKSLNHLTPFNCGLLLLLFTMIIMLCEVRSRKIYWWYDVLLMSLQGIAGLLLLFMATCSQHPAVDNNYLLLWLNPAPLLLLPMLIYYSIKHKKPLFMWVQVAMIVIFLATAPFVPQSYPTPIYIYATAFLARSIFHIHREKICELNTF